jgi:DNA replication protein DnaC
MNKTESPGRQQEMVKVQALNSALIEISGQPTKEPQVNIDTWAEWLGIETRNEHEIEQMIEACARWATLLKDGAKPCWISLLGKTGNGKTHCAKRLWKWAKQRFVWNRFDFEFIERVIYWPALIRDLRNGLSYDLLRDVASWPVLMIDDIGAERDATGFASEQLNTLLGCRVNKWTIITSNLLLEQLGGIDSRIADRIIREPGNQWVEVVSTPSYGVVKALIRNGL